MRLLILTQKIDYTDSVLGFMHQWVAQLATRLEKINVICLQRGATNLPANVRVHSLRKEERPARWRYLRWLARFLWRLDQEYEAVLVHMNPEYVVLAGWWWKLRGKKIYLWYNHPQGNWRTRLAFWWADVILHTSPQAFAARFAKARLMPVGVDNNQFAFSAAPRPEKTLLYVGRISPIKRVEVFLSALQILAARGEHWRCTIVGDIDMQPVVFHQAIQRQLAALQSSGQVVYEHAVPNTAVPEILAQHELLVNLTPSGSFDKVQIEALAVGTAIITCNAALAEALPVEFWTTEVTPQGVADKITHWGQLAEGEKNKLRLVGRQFVEDNHSLEKLLTALVELLAT